MIISQREKPRRPPCCFGMECLFRVDCADDPGPFVLVRVGGGGGGGPPTRWLPAVERAGGGGGGAVWVRCGGGGGGGAPPVRDGGGGGRVAPLAFEELVGRV